MRESAYMKFPLGMLLSSQYKVALSLPELQSQTNQFSHKWAPGCVAQLMDSDPPNLFLHYNVTCNAKWSDPRGHEVRVKFDLSQVTSEQTAKNLDVRVSCSCPAFLYWGAQWNLNQRDSLEGQARPLLAPPTERMDLRGHFVLCKHAWVVFKRILPSVQHNVDNILRKLDVEKHQPAPPPKERVQQQQEKMKRRQDVQEQRKQRNVDIQKDLGEAAKRRDERLLPEHYKVVRTEPATHQHEVPNEPDIHDPELERQDQQEKAEQAERDRLQQEEEAKIMQKEDTEKDVDSKTKDRELLDRKKKQEQESGMKSFLDRKYR